MDSDSRIKDLLAQNEEQKKEIDSMQKIIQRKDERIQTLEADLLRTQKEVSNLKVKITEKNDLLTQYLKDQTKPAFKHRMGAKELIIRAINKNEFLRNLEDIQMNEIVECMYQKEFKKDQYICREGAIGTELYVIAQGEVQVTVDGQLRAEMSVGKLFGELAILYNCTRTATIKAKSDTIVWALDRSGYQAIMMNLGMLRQTRYMKIFKSVPVLNGLHQKDLHKIADVLTEDFYKDGDYIIRQGASGDVFFIISEGTVRVTQQQGVDSPEVTIQELKAGDYFGEKALLGNTYRTANVIATSDVCCLSLDKENFSQLIGNVVERKYKDDEDSKTKVEDVAVEDEVVKLLSNTALEDYKKLSTLGMGGFGRVELVQFKNDPSKTFALKCLRKRHVVDTHQQAHLHSERTIMLSCKSPFITRLYKTFRCPKYLYMLLEVSLGGELWTILRNRSNFDNAQTRFCTACVLEALEYLHSKEIVYRDLKPENLLLDTTGYIKLVDFGFAKHIGGRKTWTFCGTPEYVAPEIILNKGHDISADYWSLGILIYELLTGSPPFSASDPMRTYNVILKGIDVIEFPKKVTRTATHLIKKLCRNNPAQRIGNLQGGIQDIKSHRWFQGFDWEGLKRHSMVPPIVPNVRGPTDTSNFDKFPPDMSSIPPDDLSGWDKEFGDLQNSPSWLLRGF